MERKYVAFISYRHAELDSAVAKQLHTLIEQYTVPRNLRKNGQKKLGLVFRDQEELTISSNLSDDICRALDNAEYLIVVCSHNTAQSPWVSREIEYFLSHHDQQHALAALASGEPAEVFPKPLTVRCNEKGELEEVEPLAIDIRADDIPGMKKTMRREITRLYAALIGCPYDALVMRQQRRKRRQLAAIMGTVLAVVMSFLAVTLVKNYEIDQKNDELAGMNLTLEDKNQELEDKNDELARQKAEVQMRESELLTEKGMANLAAGDTQSALENFLAALPSPEEDRPYYALAEQGLASTLGIHDADRTACRVFETVMEQNNPILAFEISPDGSRIMTFDAYSNAICYDTATGSVLWKQQITEGEFKKAVAAPAHGGVIVNADYSLSFIEWEDGSIRWNYAQDMNENPVLSPDESVLSVRSFQFTDGDAHYLHAYRFLDPGTGEVLQEVELGKSRSGKAYIGIVEDPENLPDWWFETTMYETCINGHFSADSNQFLSYYEEEVYGQSRQVHYVLIDRAAGTAQVVHRYEKEVNDANTVPLRAFLTDDNTALLTIQAQRDTNGAFHLEKVDLQTGALLWQLDTPTEDGVWFRGEDPVHVLAYTSGIIVSRGAQVYQIDDQAGELILSQTYQQPIQVLTWTDTSEISAVFADGRYSPGWINEYGINLADIYFNVSLSLDTLTEAKLYNNGMAHCTQHDGTITGVELQSAGLPGGYVAVRPQDNDCAITVKRAVDFSGVAPEAVVELLKEGEYLVYSYATPAGENRMAVGPISRNAADGTTEYAFAIVNTDTQQLEDVWTAPWNLMTGEVFFLRDGSGYVAMHTQAGISRYDAQTGESTVLAQMQTAPFPDGSSQTGNSHIYDTAVQYDDGRILTASLGENVLTYWLDGENETQVALPEGLCCEAVAGNSWYRVLLTGENGWILLADYAQTEEIRIRGFAAYCIHTEKWTRFDNLWDTSNAFATLGQKNPWLLVNDTHNQVHIYDMERGKMLYEFPLELSANSAKRLYLVGEDRYVAVQTEDNQVLLYDPADGEAFYTQQLSGTATRPLQIAVDAVRNRLYLWCNSGMQDTGYCLDMDSWTLLAQIPGLIGYDASANRILRIGKNRETYQENLRIYTALSCEALIQKGRQLAENG